MHLGALEIIIKACFKEGIDTPIELYLADDRIIYPKEKAVIAKLQGNLIYQKLKFMFSPNYTISLADMNIEITIVLY